MLTAIGTGILNVVSMGKVFRLEEAELKLTKNSTLTTDEEIKRYHNANKEFKVLSAQMIEEIKKKSGEHEASIIEGHILLAEDIEIVNTVEEALKNSSISAEWAVAEVFDNFADMFSSMDDELMSQRASDLKDIKTRLIYILQGKKMESIKDLKEQCIVVSRDLTPSQTSGINKDIILGIATEVGGKTSHTAILSQAMEIPAILGVSNLMSSVKNGDFIIMDGKTGEIIINPSDDIIEKYKKISEEQKDAKRLLEIYKDKETITKDGVKLHLFGNIGTPNHVPSLLKNGAEGVGLFRTEFLYMDRPNFPTEEEQFQVYKEVAEALEGKPVIIRTLDIGGDKDLPYFDFPDEDNPFLGYRAIRICLDKTEIFKVQLRALLRASAYGNIRIMLPMIVSLIEIRKSKELIEEVKKELSKENIAFNKDIEVGIMVETPAAAVSTDILGKECDFFSLGTNDLIQYTTAVDRGNDKISHLYTEYNPGVMRLIANTVNNAKKNNIFVGMCGEVAQNKYMIPFLIGLGLDEFSVSPTAILPTRKLISELSYKELKEKVQEILNLETSDEVFNYLKNLISE